jgi:alpha-glucosidase
MNEPALFIPLQSTMPPDVVHPGGGMPRFHAQVHNLYGLLMAQATREGLERLRPDERPVVISRSGFAGLQRYALQWTGDNSSWWEHLWMSMPQLQNMGLSGVAWAGVDVGGFGSDTTAELLTRWTEMGIFQPYCRNHSAIGTRRQEPWAFGEPWESLMRDMIKLRQRLIPYLYTLFEECHRTGAPILRPLLFEYPRDETTYAADDQFLLGDALLIAPITRAATEYRHVYLPEATWFHLWSGERIEGPAHILAHAPLGQPPLYVRANVPIPLWPDMNYVGERPADPLRLQVFPSTGQGAFTLYEDKGNGYDYRRGIYSRRRITCETSDSRVLVRIEAREGAYVPERDHVLLELRGLQSDPQDVRVNGEAVGFRQDEATGGFNVSLTESSGVTTVEVGLVT